MQKCHLSIDFANQENQAIIEKLSVVHIEMFEITLEYQNIIRRLDIV